MKGFGYAFAILGAICFIAIFFGRPQHIVTAFACALMAWACLTSDNEDNNNKQNNQNG